MYPWVGSHAPSCGRQLWGTVQNFLHHSGYCSRESTVRSPHPCGSSCRAPLLCRQPPPGLCAALPVTGFCQGSA